MSWFIDAFDMNDLHRAELMVGETASFEYRTVLNYSTPPPTELA